MQHTQMTIAGWQRFVVALLALVVAGCAPDGTELATTRRSLTANKWSPFAYQEGAYHGLMGLRGIYNTIKNSDGWFKCAHTGWATIPQVRSSFVTTTPGMAVAISVSADVYLEDAKGVQLRAMVDGQPIENNDVYFSSGNSGINAVTVFTQLKQAGVHTVEIQARVDSGSAYFRNGLLKTVIGSAETQFSGRAVRQFRFLNSTIWQQWPQIEPVVIAARQRDTLIATVSTDLRGPLDAGIEVRVFANGMQMQPGVLRLYGNDNGGARSVQFALSDWAYDSDVTLTVEYRRIDRTDVNLLGALTTTVIGESRAPKTHDQRVLTLRPLRAFDGQLDRWQPLVLDQLVDLPANAELSVQINSSVTALNDAEAVFRLSAGSGMTAPLSRSFKRVDGDRSALSLTFSAKQLCKGGPCRVPLRLEWKTKSGYLTLHNPLVILRAETIAVPDLAESVLMKNKHVGTGPVIEVILFDDRSSRGDFLYRPEDYRSMFQRDKGIIDFWRQTSGRKFALSEVHVRGWFSIDDYLDAVAAGKTPPLPPGEYLNKGIHGKLDIEDIGAAYAPYDDKCEEFKGPFRKAGHFTRYLALETARANGIDFTKYDRNNNGVLERDEVIFVVLGRQTETDFQAPGAPRSPVIRHQNAIDGGGAAREMYWVFCPGWIRPFDGDYRLKDPAGRNGKLFEPAPTVVAAWRGDANLAGDVHVLNHELGHVMFGFDDLYSGDESSSIPRQFALMSHGYSGKKTSTVIGPYGLALGWYTPLVVSRTGNYELTELQDSHQVLVLPRQGARYGTEYYLITNRVSRAPGDPQYYDEDLGESGLAIWHVIEPSAPGAEALYSQPQRCYTNNKHHLDQKTIRLIRPRNSLHGRRLWNALNPELLDHKANYQCADISNGWFGDQTLTWADGTRSGYQIRNIPVPGHVMRFEISVASCRDRCNTEPNALACQCDAECVERGDCCNDKPLLGF